MFFGDWLSRWARYTPNKVALVDSDANTRLTYREFNERADRLASALRHTHGIEKGDRIAVLAHNSASYLELFFATGKLGAILVPINCRLVADEVRFVLANSGAKAFFYGPEFAAVAQGLAGELAIAHAVPFGPEAGKTDYEALLAAAPAGVPVPAEIALDDPHVILYTSGTTGTPKGAILTHGTITWNAINTQTGWDLGHNDITLTHTPFFHTGGLNVLTTPLIHRGGTIVLMRQFDAARSLALIDQERCTVVFAVPTMFQMMLESPNFAHAKLGSLRFFIAGGAPCPVSLIEAYDSRGLTFKQGYGLTEAGPNCFTLDARDAVRKAGSVGFPNFHLDVRLVDDDGHDVAPGAVGELLIRGPHVTPGYWQNPEATATALANGWLHTGDLVRQDDEGYYYIVDRKKDMIISGGENIYPAELEGVLAGHPLIAEAAVIPVPDPKWGESGRAIVVLREPGALTEAAVIAFMAEKLARFKLPKSVIFVSALPRNASGKVLKQELKALYGAPTPAAPART